MDETDSHESYYGMTYGVYHVALSSNGMYQISAITLSLMRKIYINFLSVEF